MACVAMDGNCGKWMKQKIYFHTSFLFPGIVTNFDICFQLMGQFRRILASDNSEMGFNRCPDNHDPLANQKRFMVKGGNFDPASYR
jgi:hypothetical protein